MIKHIVLFTLKDFAAGASRTENARKIKHLLEGLKNKIDVIVSIEVGVNINRTASDFDIALYSEFETRQDLETYQNHPEHLKAGEFISKVRSDRKVIDYEV
jgi:hypothetical protein